MGFVVLLALLSSVFYGASDFLGGLSSRKLPVVTGQSLSLLAWVAVVIAILATTLISVSTGSAVERITARGAVLAVISGITPGLTVVALDVAPENSGVIPAFLDIAVGLGVLLALIAFPRFRRGDGWMRGERAVSARLLPVGWRVWSLAASGGALLGVGNVLLILALHAGNLAVVAVLVSLYPLATVLLAGVVLKERIGLVQLAGVVLAITAAVMLGLS